MENKFKYDAFISYRHTDLDKFVAENVHKQLESFRLPKSAAKKNKGGKTKIERVFRDKDELPLTSNLEDPIVQALQNSEWLIVICSPRLRESLWCRKEIETFVSLRGREHVLAVLIEGEPSESFPDELLYKIEKRTLPGGTVEEVKIPVEPLAADVRGKTKKDMLKAMKTELLRLLATMFGVDYDDLRQRHRERKMRRIVTASLIGGAACLLFGIYSTATALRIQKQNEQIEAQSAEIQAQSAEIQAQSLEIQARNEELALRQARSLAELATQALDEGDRAGAIKTALEALTESDGITLPYTAEAHLILSDSLRLYDTGSVYRAEYQFETAGAIDDIENSPDGDTLVIYDDTGTLTLFDLKSREIIHIIDPEEYTRYAFSGCTFLGKDKFAYSNAENDICIYDLNERTIVKTIDIPYASTLYADSEGKYLLTELLDGDYAVYDGETFEELGVTPKVQTDNYIEGPFVFSDGTMVCGYTSGREFGSQEYTLYFIDLNTMQTISTYSMSNKIPENVEIENGIAYIASTRYSENLMNNDAFASAVEIESGKLIWEYEQKGYWAEEIDLPAHEGGKYLNFLTGENAVIMDMHTGEVNFTVSLTSYHRESVVSKVNDIFLVFCEDGELQSISAEDGQCYDFSHKFECKTTSNQEIIYTAGGMVVLEKNSNRVTIYTIQTGPDVTEITEEHHLPKGFTECTGDKAVEVARGYKLENPEYVASLYHDAEKNYCYVQYGDNSFVIYDVKNGEVVYTMEWAYPTEWCLGTDEQGYTYLLGYYGCYILNENMEPFMWIPEAVDVDMENQKVFLSDNYSYYEAPIYSLEELIEMAKDHTSKG